MQERVVERRLAAILAADVIGYSRLMGSDEVGTLRILQASRRELIDPTIAARGGRIVKTTGDGLLAEFPSPVEAVISAIAVQRGLAQRNDPVPEDRRLVLRIGINLGDIIIEANDIFGDGVNIAARLETLCTPGGLCISRTVRDQVRDRLPIAFEDLGEQEVKNIARPVRVFGLSASAIADLPDLAPAAPLPPMQRNGSRSVRHRFTWAASGLIVLLIGGGGAWWALRSSTSAPSLPATGPAPASPGATTHASIAVLPFASQTPDGSDYFADGLTEDIIAALGRFRDVSVISRGGVAAYKGKSPSPEQVGRDLSVRYVVEGSVRRTPERVRVAVDLTDTMRNVVLWSKKFDSEPKDVFSIQDQITREISGALAVQVTAQELARSSAKPPEKLEAYDLVLQGRALLSLVTRTDNAAARGLFERAVVLDPGYAPAYVGSGRVDLNAVTQGWSADPNATLEHAESVARKAIALDDLLPGAHSLLGSAELYFGEYDRALDELRRATELNGSDPDAYSGLLNGLLWSGDISGAISAGELLLQLRPVLSSAEAFHLATAYILADQPTKAIRVAEQSLDRNRGNVYVNVILAMAYAAAGRQSQAGRQADYVRQHFPPAALADFGELMRDPAQRDRLTSALSKAGL